MPILQKTASAYKNWHELLIHFPRLSKYSLGLKIDNLFCNLIELLLTAGQTSRENKHSIIEKSSIRLDTLKYFLTLAWELKAIDNKKFIPLSTQLNEVGKMLGGWKKQIQNLPG